MADEELKGEFRVYEGNNTPIDLPTPKIEVGVAMANVGACEGSSVPNPDMHLIYLDYVDEDKGAQLRVEVYTDETELLSRVKELFELYGEDLAVEVIQGQRWNIEPPRQAWTMGIQAPSRDRVVLDR